MTHNHPFMTTAAKEAVKTVVLVGQRLQRVERAARLAAEAVDHPGALPTEIWIFILSFAKRSGLGQRKRHLPLCGDVNLNVKSVPFSSYERLPSDLEGAYKELYNDDVLLDSLGGALMQPVSLPWGESGWHVFCLDTSTPKAIGNPNHTWMSGGQVVWATAGATHKF